MGHPLDPTETPEWRALDVLLLRPIGDDLQFIARHGSGDFLDSLGDLRRELWEATEHAKRPYALSKVDAALRLANSCGFSETAAKAVLLWNAYRAEPLKRIARAVADEADRIRNALKQHGAAA